MRNVYADIDELTEQLRDAMQAQKARAADFLAKFDMSLIYHENALEGVVFTSNELVAALDPNAVAGDASLVPVFTEIRNHKAAIDFVREEAANKKAKITMTFVKRLYEILGTGIEGREKAVYRKDMPLHRTYFHDIALPAKIPALLEKLVDSTTTAEFRENHPIMQAALVQWGLMQAFPFSDNSGKVGRLLSHFVLVRQGYLPAVIHAIDRQRYYEALRFPVASLGQLLAEATANSLENALKFFQDSKPLAQGRASNG